MELSEEKIQEWIKETALAVQLSTKKEHSGLIGDLKTQVGLIHEAQKTIDKKLDTYIDEDTKWKEENKPYLQALANVTGAGKILVWIALGFSAIIGAWFTIRELWEK